MKMPGSWCRPLTGAAAAPGANVTPAEQVRDELHAVAIAPAMWAVVRSSPTGAEKMASGGPVTIAEMASDIGRLLGKGDRVRLGALKYPDGEPMQILADATRLRDDIGWPPAFDLSRGPADTIEWWRGRAARD
jgi:nucleoside-diphosphate-sugar epimerase